MKWTMPLFTVIAVGCATGPPAPADVAVQVDRTQPHPRLLLTPAEVDALRAKADAQGWAGKVRDRVVARAEALVEEPLDIPHAPGQWTHWYVCDEHGARLRPESPTRHVCPVDGEVYTGDPYDAVYVSMRHNHWLQGVFTLGLAWQLTRRPEFPERARAILLEYAGFYKDLPMHNKHGSPEGSAARLYAQTLDEAVTLCKVAAGCDLLYDAPSITAADRRRIEVNLLRPAVRVIGLADKGISNWQSWHNAATAMVGYLLADEDMVEHAVNGRHGFLWQMENGVGPAGMWWEGAPVYHFYTLTAHHYLLEAARRAGTDLYDRPAVLAMFAAPARQLLPDGTFAPLNDSDRVPISRYRALLELGYARYGLDTLAPLLAPRTSEEALMWGVPEVEPGEAAARTASYAEAADHLAVLRTGDGEAMALLDYGPAMGGHAHPASLNLVVYAAGDLRLIDPGRTAYGHALQDAWYKRTVAHNTVLVDGRGHRLSQGRLLAWDDAGDRVVARTRTEKAYDGVLLDRTVVMTGDWLLDIVHARSDTSRTFDLLSHFGGTPEGVDAGAPTELYDENGYQHIEEPRVASGLGAFTLATGDGALAVRMAGHAAAFLGAGRHDADHKRHPLVVRRAEGATATFAMLMALRPGVDLPRLVVEEAADAWPRVAAGTVVVRVADDALEVDGEAVAAAPD